MEKKPESGLMVARRNLLKAALTAGGAVVAAKTLPDGWIRPVINAVDLPLHAQSSGCTVYAATGLTADGFGGDELGIVCVTVCGTAATATFQTQFGGNTSDARRTGSFVNGVGTMTITLFGTGCNVGGPRSTTLTSITGSSLIYTMQRGDQGPFIATLPVVSQCPTFPAVNGDCGGIAPEPRR